MSNIYMPNSLATSPLDISSDNSRKAARGHPSDPLAQVAEGRHELPLAQPEYDEHGRDAEPDHERHSDGYKPFFRR